MRRDERADDRRASYRAGASFNALTFAATIFVALISSVVTSRVYGLDVIGQYALALGAVSAVRLLSTTKERPALVRQLALLEARAPQVTGLAIATLVFSVGLTLVVGALAVVGIRLLLSGPIAKPALFLPVAATVACYALIGNTSENFELVFGAFRAGRQLFWIRLVDGVSFIAIAVPMAVVTETVWGLIAAVVVSQVIGLVHRLVRVRHFMRLWVSRDELRTGFRTLPDLIRFGLKITPGALADGGSNESGTWLVASFGSIAAVGAYGRAYLLVKQLTGVQRYANEMLFPTLLERRAKGDGKGYARALVDSIRYTTVGLLLLTALGAGVSHGIMHTFGPGFERGADALALLLLVPPLGVMAQTQRFALLSLDRPWLGSVSGLLRLGLTLALGVLLTWKLGAVGAALALAVGLLANFAFCTTIVRRHLETPFLKLWPLRQQFGLLVACGCGFLISREVYAQLGFPVGLFASGLIGGAASIALLFIGGVVNERDWERINGVRRAISQRRSKPVAVYSYEPAWSALRRMSQDGQQRDRAQISEIPVAFPAPRANDVAPSPDEPTWSSLRHLSPTRQQDSSRTG